jgi:hypothetical protein
MAVNNKKAPEVKAPPIISKLPIAISDSPLVIDLPDGQKLVVGRMVQGSVIEVATWRGTGRPDSRTSRLMLGMSIDGVSQSAEEKAAEEAANAASAPAQRTSAISNPQLARAQEFLWAVTSHPIFKKLFGKPEEKKVRTPKAQTQAPAPISTPTSTDTAVTSVPIAPISPIAPVSTTPPAPVKKSKQARGRSLFGMKSGKKSGKKPELPSVPWSTTASASKSTTPDIDAWLDEISSKAKARVESAEKKGAKPVTTSKSTRVAKKTVKKSAPVAKKRK